MKIFVNHKEIVMKKMKQFKRMLLITALSLGCVQTATANNNDGLPSQTLRTWGRGGLIACIFYPEVVHKFDKYNKLYQVDFNVYWGAYSNYFNQFSRNGNKMIYFFSDFNGDDLLFTATIANSGTLKGCYQVNSERAIRKLYPNAQVYTCGRNISC